MVQSDETNELILLVRHRHDWPDSRGFRLVLAERAENDTDLLGLPALTPEDDADG